MTKKFFSIIHLFLILFVLLIILRNAWLCDDAYITFRTVDNFVSGNGLTWNIAERVQAYTHPLWLMIISVFYMFTKEIYYTVILLSLICCALTLFIFAKKFTVSTMNTLFCFAVLVISKSFVEYSTSGLEIPLSNLIILLFLIVYLKKEPTLKNLFYLSLISSAGLLTRLDLSLIFLPMIIHTAIRIKDKNKYKELLKGFAPIIIWELFSLFYYGFPFPNTAYAKLNTGIARPELIKQGLLYLLESLSSDPVCLFIIITSCVIVFVKFKKFVPFALGILFYLLYTVIIGGDFMSGRFLVIPFFCSIIMFSCFSENLKRTEYISLFIIMLGLAVISKSPHLFTTSKKEVNYENLKDLIDKNGISDEHSFYYKTSGLLKTERNIKHPYDFYWIYKAKMILEQLSQPSPIVVRGSIGFLGYYAGPEIPIIDLYALPDALLARLPAIQNPYWRIGHFERMLPDGYLKSIEDNKNKLRDNDLYAFYDKLSLITRGSLFSLDRLWAIFMMNIGKYFTDNPAYEIKTKFSYRYPNITTMQINEFQQLRSASKYINITTAGLKIDLNQPVCTNKIELHIESSDNYQVIYIDDNSQTVGKQTLFKWQADDNSAENKIYIRYLTVPDKVQKRKISSIIIFPLDPQKAHRISYAAVNS